METIIHHSPLAGPDSGDMVTPEPGSEPGASETAPPAFLYYLFQQYPEWQQAGYRAQAEADKPRRRSRQNPQ